MDNLTIQILGYVLSIGGLVMAGLALYAGYKESKKSPLQVESERVRAIQKLARGINLDIKA